MICEGYFFEQMTDKELEELTNLDAKKLASKKRAITRALAKSRVGDRPDGPTSLPRFSDYVSDFSLLAE
jgi:hypothetical protein